MSNKTITWLTSVNYRETGPFNPEELALRAKNRIFTWDMYVYRFPLDDIWRPARDTPELKQLLLRHFPLQAGDTGPAGGYVIENSFKQLVEVSPCDAGFCAWEDALNICKNFTCNGFGNWRLPSIDELKRCGGFVSHQLRVRKSLRETDEVILHWSNLRKEETAVAVVTCDIKDEYVPAYILSYMSGISGGYWKSRNGPRCFDEVKCPVTDWRSVRPVRDLNSQAAVLKPQSAADSKAK